MMNNRFFFELSPLFLLVIFIFSAAIALFLYYKDKKLQTFIKSQKIFLSILRFFSIFFISILLLSPYVKTTKRFYEKPIVVIAVDNTKSVEDACKNKPYFKYNILKIRRLIESLHKKFDIKTLSFGSEIKDTVFNFDQNRTNFSVLFNYISDKFYNKNLSAVVIISDGIYNSGQNPVFQAKNLQYPVYTVGIGDTASYFDASVKDVFYNEYVFINTKFQVDVAIKAEKLKGKTLKLGIKHKEKVVAEQKITVPSEHYYKKISFFISAKQAGTQYYTAFVNVFKDEKNKKNNLYTFAVKVIKNKQKILLLANSPSPDLSAIANALKKNKNNKVDIKFIYDDDFKIDDYSLIILHNLPSKNSKVDPYLAAIKQQKKPLFLICGTQTDYNALNEMNLGVNYTRSGNFEEAQVIVNTDFGEFEINKGLPGFLEKAPPLLTTLSSPEISKKYDVIATKKIMGVNTGQPLIIFSKYTAYNNAGVLMILGENLWRLRMFDYKNNMSFDLFDDFINKLAMVVTSYNAEKRFIVRGPKTVNYGEDVVFSAHLYDKIYQPVNDSTVHLTLKDSLGNSYDFTFTQTGKAYSLNIGTMPPGFYTYIARTQWGKDRFMASGRFRILKNSIENIDLQANWTLLKQISHETGGKFLDINTSDSLVQIIINSPYNKTIVRSIDSISDFIKFKLLFFIILLLMTAEWFFRKFWGTV